VVGEVVEVLTVNQEMDIVRYKDKFNLEHFRTIWVFNDTFNLMD